MVPFGVGTHIVECLRIAQLIERHGEVFLRRVFTSQEIACCSSSRFATQAYAAQWCGKEAVLRAIGIGFVNGMSWHDIEILPDGGTRHRVVLHGLLLKSREDQRIGKILVSLSHCRSHATAYGIALPG